MYTLEQIQNIKLMRKKMKPEHIAEVTGKTKGAIIQVLHREKKRGYEYPKLKHGNMKHDIEKAKEWRDLVKSGMNYAYISETYMVHPSTICRTLAMEARGELGW